MKTKKPERITPKKQSELQIESLNNSRLLITGGIILSVFAFVLYLNTFGHDYAYDDTAVIIGNRLTTQGLSGIPEILKTSYWFGFTGMNEYIYRPLPLISFAVEWQLSPANPHLSHVTNTVLFMLTGFLLFIFLAGLLKNYNLIIPFSASLLFIAHPIHTEVVANIKGRDEIFCFLFFIISGIALLKSIDKKSILFTIIASVSYFLALCSKETAYTFIFIFPLIIFYFRNIPVKKIIYHSLPFAATLLLYIVVRASVLPSLELHKETDFLNNTLVLAKDFNTRVGTAFYVMGLYIRLLIFPHPLSSDYSFSQIPISGLLNPHSLISFLFYSFIFIYSLMKIFQKKYLSFSILLFLIPLLLIANIFFLTGSTMAERFLYIPSLGFCLALSWFLMHIFKISISSEKYQSIINLVRKNIYYFIFISVILVLYSFKTINRNAVWENNFTLFSTDSKTSPNSAILHYNFGDNLFGSLKTGVVPADKKKEYLQSAQKEFQTAYSLYPDYFESYFQLAGTYYYDNQDSLSVVYYKRALTLAPENAATIRNLSISLIRFSENGKSPDVINKLLSKEEINGLANSLIKIGDTDLLSRVYKILIILDPQNIKLYNSLGVIYYNTGRFKEAIEIFNKIVSINPNIVEALTNLGSCYAKINEFEKSAECFRKAIVLVPNNPSNYNNLAIVLRQKGDSVSAEKYFAKANELRNKLPH